MKLKNYYQKKQRALTLDNKQNIEITEKSKYII